jgi:uncharacterized protein YbjT (DUF2867 family)
MTVDSVLVVGATGRQGGHVARHLLDDGVAVHAMTRNPEGDAAQALAERGATVVAGDLDDRDSLDDAMADVDGVYLVTTWEDGPEVEVERGIRAADAAAAAGVDHLVFSSVTGAVGSGVDVFESKGEIEAHLRTLDVPTTVVRPAYFMDNLAGERAALEAGTLSLPLEAGNALQMIALDDVGALVAAAFADPDRYAGETIELAGDELTLEGIGARLAAVCGYDLEIVHVPVDRYRAEAGDRYGDMYRYLNDAGDASPTDLRASHDVSFTRFEEFLGGWS